MQVVRNQPITAFVCQFGVDGKCERDDANLRITGLHELRGMRNVFAINQLGFKIFPKAGCTQRFFGPFPIGCMLGIGDGDTDDFRIGQAGQRHLARVHACAPQHDAADCVGHYLGGRKALPGQFAWKGDVGREIKVVRGALLDLRVELARRTVNHVNFVVRVGVLERGDDLVHRELEIGSCSHSNFFGMGRQGERQSAGKQKGFDKSHGFLSCAIKNQKEPARPGFAMFHSSLSQK